jgi:hypothetical protein
MLSHFASVGSEDVKERTLQRGLGARDSAHLDPR